MRPPIVRHRIELTNPETALEQLDGFGTFVGPRIGVNKRNQNQMDDFCVRRMMLGLLGGRLPVPRIIEMLAPDPEGSWPDALLEWSDGSKSGLEITTATSEEYQRQLTREERIASALPEGEVAVFDASVDGYVGAPTDAIAQQISTAVAKKGQARASGAKYAGVPTCDLLIYENSDGGLFLEPNSTEDVSKIVLDLRFGKHRRSASVVNTFRFVHLLVGRFFVHSLLGDARTYRLAAQLSKVMS